ncbi:MAG: ferrous iron transporter B [Clostridiales bacterium]|nr:ferrous iron transporter B [Clostridiales bacterium]
MNGRVIALCGNPNTGKSTIFNTLTGLKQHTGNWSGKTVGAVCGRFEAFTIADLPGMYSLNAKSPDEEKAVEFLKNNEAELTAVIIDGTCIERNLILALQIADITKRVVICINMMDEAANKGIEIDIKGLEGELGLKIISMAAGRGKGLEGLKQVFYDGVPDRDIKGLKNTEYYNKRARELYKKYISAKKEASEYFDRKIDSLVLSGRWGIPLTMLVFIFMLWLTVAGANYPSALLARFFAFSKALLYDALTAFGVNEALKDLCVNGIFGTVGEIVSVMLPPMAVFFPLFAFMEDLGFLPRIAFNLDRFFKAAGTNGKQALCMCMGIGCNAAGVISSRIIESPKERRAAVLTNAFMPCNGRFPLIITLSVMFFSVGGFTSLVSALSVFGALVLGTVMTLIVTKILMRGEKSSFVLELPPYRRPRIRRIIINSIKDRILFVLSRAVMAAVPAGIVIWLLKNISLSGISLMNYAAGFFDPLGRLMGLDGCILTGFILGIPANEIVLPLILMMYSGSGSTAEILISNGWTAKTALCAVIFCLFHFPCTTTLLTIKK